MNGRGDRRKRATGRVAGRFLALPFDVLDSAAYRGLSGAAVRLLLELGRQYNSTNNGRLLTSMAYLKRRGWTSADTVTKATRELETAGLIHQTVKGHRPNKASWWALTWQDLDRMAGYDPGTAVTFLKGAYRNGENVGLIPKIGAKAPLVAPKAGAVTMVPTPNTGAMKGESVDRPAPRTGNHLENHLPQPLLMSG